LASKGQLVGVAPGETHPVSAGKLCARGWSAHEAALWGDRLQRPLLQRDGKQESVSWNEALDHVVRRLKQLMQAGKPIGVLGSSRATNEENYLAGRLARAGLETNNVDFSYHPICRPLLQGFEEACGGHATLLRLHEIASSQVILLIEGNLAETHPRVASSVVKAVEKGARLITAGGKKTQMARLASLHLQVMHGSEGETINDLLAAVIDLGLKERMPAAAGYSALGRDLQTGQRTEEVRQAAEWIVRAERAAFLMGPTCGQGDQPRKDAAAFARLAALSGHLGKPGSGLLPLLARSNVRGACDMAVVPDRLPGYEPLDDARSRQRVQDLWGKKLPPGPGCSAESLLQSVSGLIVVADDPPSVLPMGQRALAALGNVEFLVVLDAFSTPTARIAHVVLPIASFAETEGTLTNMEGRVQRVRPVTDPPGEARTGWHVLAELCTRFGVAGSFRSASEVLREIGQAAPQYAGIEQQLSASEWDGAFTADSGRARPAVPLAETPRGTALTSAELPYLLARDGAFDWGQDPLVLFSPTLSRDYQSERKLFPNGFIEMGKGDADALKLSGGRQIRLTSAHGEAVVPVRVRTDLKPGLLIVPYAFRDRVSDVLGADSVTAVRIGFP
jgi:predicted molibdopterin-dependent oxidoreductase YjgC